MPRNHEWQTRIKAVEREHLAIRQATDRFQESAHRDPTILAGDLRYREIIRASENLDGTYLVRLFAEFETGLTTTAGELERLVDANGWEPRYPCLRYRGTSPSPRG